jgi:hypothetical protein
MRGQAYTLESVIAALLILSALVFALQVTTVTPLSASTSSQHIENQQRSAASGALTAAAEAGALKPSLSRIDTEGVYYSEGPDGAYVSEYPPGEFGNILNRTFGSRGLAVDVRIRYQTSDTTWNSIQMVQRGTPSDNAVTTTQSVTLYDEDPVYHEDGTQYGTWGDEDPFEVGGQVNQNSDVYNVVTVVVTVWRM